MPGAADAKVRAHLGRFGLEQAKADTRIGDLSGGEKARLVLAAITTGAPHMLLLDEPTNHLDIDAREALVQALNSFEGAVVLVSHDPHLVSLVADRLWLVRDGRCQSYDGDVTDYRRSILDAGREARREEKRAEMRPTASKRENRRKRAEDRAAKASLRQTVRNAEKHMEAVARERDALAAKLADPAIYEGPTADFAALAIRKAELDQNLESEFLETRDIVWCDRDATLTMSSAPVRRRTLTSLASSSTRARVIGFAPNSASAARITGAAAIKCPSSSPGAAVIILLSAKPFDIRIADG